MTRISLALLVGTSALGLVASASFLPSAAASTATETLRSVSPSDVAPWDPAATAAPSTRWFLLPGDQEGQATYSFVPSPALGLPGGLRLSAPGAGDSITLMTLAPSGSSPADVQLYLEPSSTVGSSGHLVAVADLDCNGATTGGEVRATGTATGGWWSGQVVLDRDVHADGTTGAGAGVVAYPAGSPVQVSKLATLCPTALRFGVTAAAGTVGTLADLHAFNSSSADILTDVFRSTAPGATPAVRLGGRDRIDTALAVDVRTTPGQASRVIMATSAEYPDSVVGSALAQVYDAPLVINPTAGLDTRVASFLHRHVVPHGHVILLGGTGALSAKVEKQVQALGLTTERWGGRDRYETAVIVATHMRSRRCGVDEYDQVACGATFADGTNFPDAISGSTLRQPILYTRGTTMPAATRDYIATVASSADALYAVGGPAATAASGLAVSPRVQRFVGADRYETSALVYRRYTGRGRLTALATGENFPDALVGSTLAPVLLTRSASLPPSIATALTGRAPLIEPLVVLGTSDVTADSVVHEAQKALAAGQVTSSVYSY